MGNFYVGQTDYIDRLNELSTKDEIVAITAIAGSGNGQFPNGSAAAPSISFASNSNTGFYKYASNSIGISTNGVNIAIVDALGNLGVGVSPSAWSSGEAAIQNKYGNFASAASVLTLASNYYNSAGQVPRYVESNPASVYKQVLGEHRWLSAATGVAGGAMTLTQLMTLKASGNLGIGTTNPAYKLDVPNEVAFGNNVFISNRSGSSNATLNLTGWNVGVSANTQIFSDYTGNLRFQPASGMVGKFLSAIDVFGPVAAINPTYSNYSTGYIAAHLSNDQYLPGLDIRRWTGIGTYHAVTRIASDVGGNIRFYSDTAATNIPATTNLMTLMNSGGLGIGTVSPDQKLEVAISGGGLAAKFSNTTLTATSTGIQIGGYESSSSTAYGAFIRAHHNFGLSGAADLAFETDGGIERLRITSNGNIGIGTVAPNASAILDVQSTTKGVRMPNMTTTQKNAIASPAPGLMVFDTTLSKLCVYTGAAWQTITSA